MVTWGRDSPTTGGRGRSRSVARTVRAVFSLLVNLQHHFVSPHPRPSDNYYLSAGTVGKVHPVLVNLERLGFRWREGKARAFLKQCNLPPMWWSPRGLSRWRACPRGRGCCTVAAGKSWARRRAAWFPFEKRHNEWKNNFKGVLKQFRFLTPCAGHRWRRGARKTSARRPTTTSASRTRCGGLTCWTNICQFSLFLNEN